MKKIFQSIGLAALASAFVLYFAAEQVARSGVSCSVPNTFSNGTTADATQVNANFAALVACFANTAEAGANSSITALTGLTTPLTAGQGGTLYFWGGTAVGTNTIAVTTVTPSSGFTFQGGVRVCFLPGGTNTGATTLNVNGTGAKSFYRQIQLSTGIGIGMMVGGEILSASNIVCAVGAASGVYVLEGQIAYVGAIADFGYAGCPAGWLEANAGSFNTTNFPDLNGALGTTWGIAGTLPDLRGTATYGRDSGGSGRITVAGGNVDGTTVGTTQYQQNKVVQKVNLAAFSLNVTDPGHTHSFTGQLATNTSIGGVAPRNDGANGTTTTSSVTTGITVASGGSSTPMSILPNAAVVTKCVKL
jgi:hypothetical protein